MTRAEGEAPASPAWYESYRRLASSGIRACFEPLDGPVYELCAYHLGWRNSAGRPENGDTGKMLRPVLCLVACHGFANPGEAVGPAAAVELLHAFSLAHDDIEDGDRERRHRPTLWAQYGVPLALNAGDALYALAVATLHASISRLATDRIGLALSLFSNACLRLVEGQHLDLEFETREAVDSAEYLTMARGKTGALLGAALALGALFGRAPISAVECLQTAGIELGLAFQARDDALALWGDPTRTGKAAGNDLKRGKKSLPSVLAAERGLRTDWFENRSLEEARDHLERLGVRGAIDVFAAEHAAHARRLAEEAKLAPEAFAQLLSLIDLAIARES